VVNGSEPPKPATGSLSPAGARASTTEQSAASLPEDLDAVADQFIERYA
jgi:hypothetical protein